MIDIHTYIQQIALWQDVFPEDALAHLADREEEAKPHLRGLLQSVLHSYKELPEDFVGHIFALYLLAQFRDPSGFDLAIKFLELPEPYPRALFHDLLEQNYPAVIASCYSGDPGPLFALVANKKLSFLPRVVGLVALSILVHRKSLDRATYAQFLLDLIQNESDKKILAAIAEEVAELHLGELYQKIQELYQNNLVDSEQFSQKLFDTLMQSDYANPRKFFLIDDVVDELA